MARPVIVGRVDAGIADVTYFQRPVQPRGALHSYDYAVLRNTLTDDFEMLIFGRRLDADGFEQLLRGMEERGVEFSETELLDFNTEIAGDDVAYTTWRTTRWLEGAILRRNGNRWLLDRAWSVRIPSSD